MKNRKFLLPSALFLTAFAFVSAAAWGKTEHCRAEQNRELADEYVYSTVNACARCGEELVKRTEEMSLGLEKLRICSSARRRVLALEDIVRASAEAVGLMTRLPCPQGDIMELERFVAQTGDYARTLSERILSGGEADETDEERLEEMLSVCRSLAERAEELLENGGFPTGTEDFDYYEPSKEASWPETPVLYYDGALSGETDESPKDLGPEVGAEEALRIAEELTGAGLTLTGKTEGRLPAYVFENGEREALVTVSGGRLLSFMNGSAGSSGAPDEAGYEKLVKNALAFLEKAGYPDTEPAWAEYGSGAAVITFVSRRGGILAYNDLVKVRMDAGTGEVTGLEAREYLLHGGEREVPQAKLTREEALSLISPRLKAEKVRLALLPVTPSREALCYEIRASLEDVEYLIYINAETGGEERILKLAGDETGIRAE